MDADALYLALAEKEPEDCTRQEMKADWEHLRSKDCTDSFFADAVTSYFPQKYCRKHEKNYKRGPGLFKRNSDAQRCNGHVAYFTAAMVLPQTKMKSVEKVLTNVYSSRAVMDPWRNIVALLTKTKLLRQQTEVPSNQSRCCNINHVAEKILSFFTQKEL